MKNNKHTIITDKLKEKSCRNQLEADNQAYRSKESRGSDSLGSHPSKESCRKEEPLDDTYS